MDKNTKHIKYLKVLEKIAELVEPIQSSRMAACIVRKGDMISVGINQRKTHPMQAKYSKDQRGICLHAEMKAIINAVRRLDPEDFKDCTIYVVRMKYDGPKKRNIDWAMAKPCHACSAAIISFNIKKVVYTTDNGSFEEI